MRRRGSSENPVNLFSFQDVMASIIGVLFLVVMLLALGIVDTPAAATDSPSVDQLNQALLEAQNKKTRLEDKLSSISVNRHDLKDDIERLQTRYRLALQSTERIGQEQQQAKAHQEHTNKKIKQQDQHIVRMKDEQEMLKAELRKQQSLPRVAYIIEQDTSGLEPFLVEIGKTIRTSAKDGRSHSVQFRNEREFQQWVSNTKDPSKHRFVLLLKPSGISKYGNISFYLFRNNFRIGLDLLPEAWQVIE